MELKQIIRPDTLNIFCDASIIQRLNRYDACYGAEAYNGYNKVEESYRFLSYTTNNNAEVHALREAVSLAIKYKDVFPNINIFSDSQISILGIRDRIFRWRIGSDGKLYGTTKIPIASQDIFIEIMHMIVDNEVLIRFFHQSGHVNVSNFSQLVEACHVFMSSNGIREKVDYNLIRYISNHNNDVDYNSRIRLKRYFRDPSEIYSSGLEFTTKDFYDTLQKFKNINRMIYNKDVTPDSMKGEEDE